MKSPLLSLFAKSWIPTSVISVAFPLDRNVSISAFILRSAVYAIISHDNSNRYTCYTARSWCNFLGLSLAALTLLSLSLYFRYDSGFPLHLFSFIAFYYNYSPFLAKPLVLSFCPLVSRCKIFISPCLLCRFFSSLYVLLFLSWVFVFNICRIFVRNYECLT